MFTTRGSLGSVQTRIVDLFGRSSPCMHLLESGTSTSPGSHLWKDQREGCAATFRHAYFVGCASARRTVLRRNAWYGCTLHARTHEIAVALLPFSGEFDTKHALVLCIHSREIPVAVHAFGCTLTRAHECQRGGGVTLLRTPCVGFACKNARVPC